MGNRKLWEVKELEHDSLFKTSKMPIRVSTDHLIFPKHLKKKKKY